MLGRNRYREGLKDYMMIALGAVFTAAFCGIFFSLKFNSIKRNSKSEKNKIKILV
jgi:hypothetical protein